MIGVTPTSDGCWRVTCTDHGLDRVVATAAHAANLEALHLRRDHAPADDSPALVDVNLTAAAAVVIRFCDTRPFEEGDIALAVWRALVGLDLGDDAIEDAREVAAADPPIIATVPPL